MPKGRFDAEDQSTEISKEQDPKKKKKPDLDLNLDTKTEVETDTDTNSQTATDTDTDTKTTTPSDVSMTTKADFTAADFAKLNENEHGRYAPNSKKIAHAVLTEEDDELIAIQYALPSASDDTALKVRPLINIEAIEPFRGMHRYRAQTPEGKTPMYAKRFIDGKVGEKGREESMQIACFSPSREAGKQPFWGSTRSTPLFRGNLPKSVKKDLEKELKDIVPVTKGGDELVVDHASVPGRDLLKTRTPDQNTVMGESARDAYEHFFDKMADELHPEMKQRLKRAFSAQIKDNFTKNSYRPEWMHVKGWSLMPMSMNPQTEDNLGAGPKWANTQMMILERVVKWFAIHAPESLLTIKPKFDMLLDSELIRHIDFKVRVQIKERFVELTQSIDPFQPYPLFAKASDLAQGTAITHSILHDVEPASKQVVKGGKKLKKDDKQVSQQASSSSTLLTGSRYRPRTGKLEEATHRSVTSPSVADSRKRKREDSVEDRMSSSAARPSAKDRTASDLIKETPASKITQGHHHKRQRDKEDAKQVVTEAPPVKRSRFPTQHQHEHSVVQIYTEAFIPDYDKPWRDPESTSWSGSGFIVEDDSGRKYVVTNAHVAENPIFLQVRLANDRHKKYEAKVKCVSYQCDLALLEVDDPEFNKMVKPVELGSMVNLRQKVMVVGFPMGGTEISLSKGIVSRIQVDDYSMSGQRLLQVQVDAAINSGNSGGPTFSGGKVVGVAFQSYHLHGLGYIIPIPILRHFLAEAFSGKPYRGFPTIPMITEELENQHERAFYQLGKRTGVRVKKVDYLSNAFSKLKPDDVLLSIDGLPISNEGTVDIPDIGNCIDLFHVTQSKFIGDQVRLRVLRRKPTDKTIEELDIDVVLDTILGDTEKVPVEEHDKMPTFYINSGISFVPLTRNYMDGDGAEFEEMHLVEEGCSLADAPKRNPNEQIVVINSILKCNETQGYEKHLNGIVKQINGKPINHIRDVVLAMEGNKDERHVISLASKSIIVVPNMSAHEHARLLKRHHISIERSADLVAKSGDAPRCAPHNLHQGSSALYVEELELTQLGMRALFARMGYPNTISGSIYDGIPTVNLGAFHAQGFMPVLTDVGAGQVSGHWIMLIQGQPNQYYLFDPLGHASGMSYRRILATQLPEGASLHVIPNGVGLNQGLCGYWVASVGLRACTALNRGASPNLMSLGQTISDEMRAELTGDGYIRITHWLRAVAEGFPGAPAAQPIDATDLRRATEVALDAHAVAPIPKKPLSVGLFGKPLVENPDEKSKLKRKRILVESSSDEEDEEEVKTPSSPRKNAWDSLIKKGFISGGRDLSEKEIDAIAERYKDVPDIEVEDEEDEEDDDYIDSSDESSDHSESSTETEKAEDDEGMETEIDSEAAEQSPPLKLRRQNAMVLSHGFFKPLSTKADDPLLQKRENLLSK